MVHIEFVQKKVIIIFNHLNSFDVSYILWVPDRASVLDNTSIMDLRMVSAFMLRKSLLLSHYESALPESFVDNRIKAEVYIQSLPRGQRSFQGDSGRKCKV